MEWKIITYDYMNTFYDKVYESKIIDKDILSDVLKLDSKDATKDLAGDLGNEKYVILTDVFKEKLYQELKVHLERIYGSKIHEINIFSKQRDNYSIWINRQSAGEYNPTHNHTGYLSYVFYPKIPNVIREEHKAQKGNSKTRGLIQFSSERTNTSLKLAIYGMENNYL